MFNKRCKHQWYKLYVGTTNVWIFSIWYKVEYCEKCKKKRKRLG